jgi:hypothetical protein
MVWDSTYVTNALKLTHGTVNTVMTVKEKWE